MKKHKINFKTPKRKSISISTELAISILLVTAVMLSLVYCMNSVFLSKVYLRYKKEGMQEAFSEIDEACADGKLYSTDYRVEFEKICGRENIQILITSSDYKPVLTSQNEKDMLLMQLYKVMYSEIQDDDGDKEVYSDTKYTIELRKDSRMGEQYLILWGTLSDGNLIIMRAGTLPIKESAKISNSFLLFIALIVICVAMIVSYLIGEKITEPVKQLNKISKSMTNLDFNAKYVPRKRMNELDQLGENMNSMSEKLEQTILELKQANLSLKHDISVLNDNEKRRREFLSNVSHELKTPIALIQGYAEGLSDGIFTDPEDQKYYADVISDEAKKMNTIVKELLDLNQLEGGQYNLDLHRFDIVELIKGTIAENRLMIEENKITVKFPYDEPFYVVGDDFFIERVFTNYLTNAIHYCEGEKIIDIRLENIDDGVKISVMNTGNAIPEDSIGHVFEKFYKVDKARTRAYGGSGIGLSIVKAVMELHGRDYGVYNVDGGVVFYFTLDKG